jgi:hypothetical protein
MINSRAQSHFAGFSRRTFPLDSVARSRHGAPTPKVGVEIEIISLGGLEDLFREFGNASLPDPETLAGMAARYGTETDFEGTMPIIERQAWFSKARATSGDTRTATA